MAASGFYQYDDERGERVTDKRGRHVYNRAVLTKGTLPVLVSGAGAREESHGIHQRSLCGAANAKKPF